MWENYASFSSTQFVSKRQQHVCKFLSNFYKMTSWQRFCYKQISKNRKITFSHCRGEKEWSLIYLKCLFPNQHLFLCEAENVRMTAALINGYVVYDMARLGSHYVKKMWWPDTYFEQKTWIHWCQMWFYWVRPNHNLWFDWLAMNYVWKYSLNGDLGVHKN